MKTKGIKILDEKNGVIIIRLQDILEDIFDGRNYIWSILFYNDSGKIINGKTITDFQNEINTSKRGLLLTWEKLNSTVCEFRGIADILIVGCKDQTKSFRYEKGQEIIFFGILILKLISL